MTDDNNKNNSSKGIRFITPPNRLKQKIGSGGISPKLIEKAQEIFDHAELDFAPYARQFLDEITTIRKTIKQGNTANIETLIIPVMEMKANGGMFKYAIISEISAIFLYFLECVHTVKTLNEDTLSVIDAHIKSLNTILSADIKGQGGSAGAKLVNELHSACIRYFDKYDIDHETINKIAIK